MVFCNKCYKSICLLYSFLYRENINYQINTCKNESMKREIIKIDEDLCNGCGECVPECHEGAIRIINGKARLISEVLCDGLGACLGHCPTGAITIETREAEAFDEQKVAEHNMKKKAVFIPGPSLHHGGGCPGSAQRVISREPAKAQGNASHQSELRQWPVQMHLINPLAPYFQGADLLLAADCVSYSVGGFHSRFLKGKTLAIACPKLDSNTESYVEKLNALIDDAKINTITLMVMEVPCCSGLLRMIRSALARSSRNVPVKQIIISIAGEVLAEEWV